MNSSSSAARVVIVDDHPGIRQGLRAMLEPNDLFELCGEAENALEALGVVEQVRPDIVVVDIALKGPTHGLELTRMLRKQHPEIAVLVLSLHGELEFATGAIAAGAGGYLSKAEAGERLHEALATVLRGETYMSPEMRQRAAATA